MLYTVWSSGVSDSSKIGIELQGKSSRLHPKKNYEFEFRTNDNSETNKSIFGMEPGDDYVLISMAYDGSYMRNALVFELWRQLGYWSPDYRYVQLFWNNTYQGLYLLCEKVKVSADRIDIKSISYQDNFLIKMGRYDHGDFDFALYGRIVDDLQPGARYKIVYPKTRKLDYRDRNKYIKKLSHISISLEKLFGCNGLKEDIPDPVDQSSAQINLNSFIDYFLLSEISKNPDAYLANLYLVNQGLFDSYKFSIGPQWDYDLAFANTNVPFFRSDSGWVYIYNAIYSAYFANSWWQDLSNASAYKDSCIKRLQQIEHVFSESNIGKITDSLMMEIMPFHQADYDLWKTGSRFLPDNIKAHKSMADEVHLLRSYMFRRKDWVHSNLAQLPKFNSPFNELMQKSNGEQLDTKGRKLSLHYPPYQHSGRYSRSGYYSYEILDSEGREISSGRFPQTKKIFDLSSYSKGIYFIHIQEQYGPGPMPTYSDVYFYENVFYWFEVE